MPKIYDWKKQTYPACVGIAKCNGKVTECWNDMKGPRKVKWYYNLIPFQYLTYNQKGVTIKLW